MSLKKLTLYFKKFKEKNIPGCRKKRFAMYGCFIFTALTSFFVLSELSFMDMTVGQEQNAIIIREMNETEHTQTERDVFETILIKLNSEPIASTYRILGILAGVFGAAFYIENRNNKKHQITLQKQGVIQESIADTIHGLKDNICDRITLMDNSFHESQSDMKAKLDKMERKSEEEKHDMNHRLDTFEKNIYKDINEKTNIVKDLVNEKMKGVELVMKNLENNDYRHEHDIQRLEDKLFSFGKHSHIGHGVKMSPSNKQAVDTNKDI